MAWATKVTTTTAAPVATLITGATQFWGLIPAYAESATFYVKLWWQGNTNTIPIVGTTPATITIPVLSTMIPLLLDEPVIMQGPLYWAATLNKGDTDATVLGTGGDILTFIVG